jgi:hypothetical protein
VQVIRIRAIDVDVREFDALFGLAEIVSVIHKDGFVANDKWPFSNKTPISQVTTRSFYRRQMTTVDLVHPGATLTVARRSLFLNCTLFENNPTLLASPYRVKSPVTIEILRRHLKARPSP